VLGDGGSVSTALFFSIGSYGLLVSTGGILSLNLSKKAALLAEPGDGVRTIAGETPPLVVDVDERVVERCSPCGDIGDRGPGECEE